MADGFHIEGLDKFQEKLLNVARVKMPEVINNILESLGEHLLGEAKEILQKEKSPHSRFAVKRRDLKSGGKRAYIKYVGKSNTNSIDTGQLWNSLSRGQRGNVWTFDNKSGNFRLVIGTNVKHARWINDGYTMNKPHWVPGIVDGNGIFRYQKGVKTGIYVKRRKFEGIEFMEIAFKELESIAPKIVKYELGRFADEFNR